MRTYNILKSITKKYFLKLFVFESLVSFEFWIHDHLSKIII